MSMRSALSKCARPVRIELLEQRMMLSAVAGPAVPAVAATSSIGFSKSIVTGTSSASPTSLQFGPDGRLYVAQQDGSIKIYTIGRKAVGKYSVTATQTITSIQAIPNHNDDGTVIASVRTRLVTGLLVTGTAAKPVIYVSSSDPRVGGGANNVDTGLDTNSGIISRLTWNGKSWDKLDLVRGLPRSVENHATNGMALDPATNTLYVAQGGTTNMGAPSHNFGYLPEYALSAAILTVNLNAIGNKTYYLPTLDDQKRAGVADPRDPFGGDAGMNQAILVSGGPVQVYSPGYRNPYDIVMTQSGRLYTIDNGSNAGWGDIPIGTGGNATNQVSEPGVSDDDQLQLVTQGFYAGHPDPTRANRANTFDPLNPQSPVTIADPQEGTYLDPGVADGALATFPDSTNGITEYTASNFGGAMQGNLLAVSLDNTLFRIVLNATGTAVTLKQALFSNVDSAPLDIVAQGDGGAYPGTIWVADIATGHIIAFDPSDNGGVTAVDDPNLDDDHDGYSNHDEILSGTNPESSADAPADSDHDFVSNLLDANDDNDGLPDTSDPFAIDSHNGRATNLPLMLDFGNDGLGDGGLLNMGFTGLMTNGKSDYSTLYDPTKLTAGGAAGVFTVDQVATGDALGAANTQNNAFQAGFNVTASSVRFTAHTRILSPFAGVTATASQSMGFYVGTGDQDNYAKLVVRGNGSIQLVREINGVVSAAVPVAVSLTKAGAIDLYLTVVPSTGSIQPAFSVTRGSVTTAIQNMGLPANVPTAWFSNTLIAPAVGVISTCGGSKTFSATWDFLSVVASTSAALIVSAPNVDFGAVRAGAGVSKVITLKNAGAAGSGPLTIQSLAFIGAAATAFASSFNNAKPVSLAPGQSVNVTLTCKPPKAGDLAASLVINQTGTNGALTIPLAAWSSSSATVSITPTQALGIDANTALPGSFVITNKSPDGQKISRVLIDLRKSLLPDLIFTPTTAGGDDAALDLTATSDPAAVGLSAHHYSAPLDGGYQILEIDFTNFAAGKAFSFRIEIDPADIKGAHSPGPSGAGEISGLELTGSQWAVSFDDGSTQAADIFRTSGSLSGGSNVFEAGAPASPVIELLGVASTPMIRTAAQQTVRINGTPGQAVQVLVAEGGLYTSGVAGGGYNLHPYEDNRIVRVWQTSAVVGAAGYVDVPITLTKTDSYAGFNHIVATFKSADGRTGPVSQDLVVQFKAAVTPPPVVVTKPTVTSLTLMNSDTGTAIQTIQNGSTIKRSSLPTQHLNVRANVAHGALSVMFGLDGVPSYRLESDTPFALFADDGAGNYYTGTFSVGTHTITVLPYSAKHGTGTVGNLLTIKFTVI